MFFSIIAYRPPLIQSLLLNLAVRLAGEDVYQWHALEEHHPGASGIAQPAHAVPPSLSADHPVDPTARVRYHIHTAPAKENE